MIPALLILAGIALAAVASWLEDHAELPLLPDLFELRGKQ